MYIYVFKEATCGYVIEANLQSFEQIFTTARLLDYYLVNIKGNTEIPKYLKESL